MLKQQWLELMKALNYADNLDVFEQLHKAYSEPHRFYHTTEHLQDCLGKLERMRGSAQQPELLALALWFHDAIYKPLSTGNEKASADWAVKFMRDNAAAQSACDKVHAMIMATLHVAKGAAGDNDTNLLLDIDLSVLGESSDVYDIYEANIRKEYRWVPWFLYRKKRREILHSFLQRASVYRHPYFQQHYEHRARDNLRRAMSAL